MHLFYGFSGKRAPAPARLSDSLFDTKHVVCFIWFPRGTDWGRMGGIGSDGTVRACLNEVNKNLVNDSNYDRVANACGM